MDKLTPLRWLAREVVPEDAVAVASVPAPLLASANRKTPVIQQYLAWWICHPDPTGHFAAKMRWLRWLPSSILVRVLFALGYDGLIFMEGDTVVGHIFYQRRSCEIHGFSVFVAKEFEGGGYGVVMAFDYVAFAARDKGVTKARMGGGKNRVNRRLQQLLRKHETKLGWRVDEDGWVTFS
jgi:GNAT superfamily N-acetyltransferase